MVLGGVADVAALELEHRSPISTRPASPTPRATPPRSSTSATPPPRAARPRPRNRRRQPGHIANNAVVIDETATADLSAHSPHAGDIVTDVLVVGGGPAGAAAGYWLARQGHDVTIIERKTFPREEDVR